MKPDAMHGLGKTSITPDPFAVILVQIASHICYKLLLYRRHHYR